MKNPIHPWAILACLPILSALNTPSQAWAAPELLETFDFDGSDGGFIIENEGFPHWEYHHAADWEAPLTGLEDGVMDGLWCTNLGEGYQRDASIYLQSPILDLGEVNQVTVEIWHNYQTQLGGDGGQVLWSESDKSEILLPFNGYPNVINGVQGPVGAFSGDSDGWIRSYFAVDGLEFASDPRLRFHFQSNGTDNEYTGWLIERVNIWNGDAIPPHFNGVIGPVTTGDFIAAQAISATIYENDALDYVRVHYHLGDEEWAAFDLEGPNGMDFSGVFPAQAPGTTIYYYLEAMDLNGNPAFYPGRSGEAQPQSLLSYAIRLPAPTQLAFDPHPGRLANRAALRWQSPPIELIPYAFRIYRGDGTVEGASVIDHLLAIDAELPHGVDLSMGSGDYLQVTALYEDPADDNTYYESEYSSPLAIDIALPQLLLMTPHEAYPGQDIWVEIVGENTDFVQGKVGLELPTGLILQNLVVENAHRLRALLSIAGDAPMGNSEIEAKVEGESRGQLPFTILDAHDRPRITSLSPPIVSQGSQLTVKFEGEAADFSADTPAVDFGMGITVVGVTVDASGKAFSVEIDVDNQCPVGQRSVRMVSGDLILTDIPFEVSRSGLAISGCNQGSSTPQGLGWAQTLLMGILLARVRRKSH